MKVSKLLVLGLVFLVGIADSCGGNPNNIGLQDYGSIVGRVLDATNNRPVPNALVSVGTLYTGYADAQGAFRLEQVPIGHQQLTANAPGYSKASRDVRVIKGRTATVDYIRIAPIGATETAPPPATPTPSPEPEQAVTEPPSAAPSTAPGASASTVPSAAPSAMPVTAPSAAPTGPQ